MKYLINPILNLKINNWSCLLTFQSPFRRYHLLRSHITAFTTAAAFIGCTDIIIALLLIINLSSDLGFVGVVDLCPLFGVLLKFKRSGPFIQFIQYEWFIPFDLEIQLIIVLFRHVITQDDEQLPIILLMPSSLSWVNSLVLYSLNFYYLLSLLG